MVIVGLLGLLVYGELLTPASGTQTLHLASQRWNSSEESADKITCKNAGFHFCLI